MAQPMPRRPKCSYNIFFKKEKDRWLKDHKRGQIEDGTRGSRFVAMTRALSNRWNQLSPEERKPYQDAAEADRQRFLKEMDEYRAEQREKAMASSRDIAKKASSCTTTNSSPTLQRLPKGNGIEDVERSSLTEMSRSEISLVSAVASTEESETSTMLLRHLQQQQQRNANSAFLSSVAPPPNGPDALASQQQGSAGMYQPGRLQDSTSSHLHDGVASRSLLFAARSAADWDHHSSSSAVLLDQLLRADQHRSTTFGGGGRSTNPSHQLDHHASSSYSVGAREDRMLAAAATRILHLQQQRLREQQEHQQRLREQQEHQQRLREQQERQELVVRFHQMANNLALENRHAELASTFLPEGARITHNLLQQQQSLAAPLATPPANSVTVQYPTSSFAHGRKMASFPGKFGY